MFDIIKSGESRKNNKKKPTPRDAEFEPARSEIKANAARMLANNPTTKDGKAIFSSFFVLESLLSVMTFCGIELFSEFIVAPDFY